MDWVPRSIRFKVRELDKANNELEAELKRRPPTKRSQNGWGSESRELQEVLAQISFVSVMARDEMVGSGDERGEPRSLLDTLADAASGDPT
jgi:RNA polymerase sigma factor FliA